MADQQHPITPSPELMEVWSREVNYHEPTFAQVAIKAAHWGADQELKACCEWASQFNYDNYRYQDELQNLRRPKPPSLKEQALAALAAADSADHPVVATVITADQHALIRAALESLPS